MGTGTASYFGELNYNNALNENISLINFGVEARLLSHISARLEADYFTLKGADSNAPDSTFQKQRNLSFHSKNFQLGLQGIYYFKKYRGDYFRRPVFDPYAFTGFSAIYYSPRADFGGESTLLRPLATEGETYGTWALGIPVGVGAKFRINDYTNINLEVAYFYTFTDYLDDVSKNYGTEFENPSAELLSNRKDEIPLVNQEFYDQMVPGAPRGEPENKDGFLMIKLKVEFYLPASLFASGE